VPKNTKVLVVGIDTPEQIDRCLSCKFHECIDCVAAEKTRVIKQKSYQKQKAVRRQSERPNTNTNQKRSK
jgi:hypothetical protein